MDDVKNRRLKPQTNTSFTPAGLDALHSAMLRPDPSTADLLVSVLVPMLSSRVSRRWPKADPQMILEAVHDTLLWYLDHPERYTAATAKLDVFLGHVAHRKMQDASRKRARARKTEVSMGDAALRVVADRQAADRSEVSDGPSTLARDRLIALARSTREREFLRASIRGDDLQHVAMALGCAGEPPARQLKAVQMVVKRLHARYTRTTGRERVKPQSGRE